MKTKPSSLLGTSSLDIGEIQKTILNITQLYADYYGNKTTLGELHDGIVKQIQSYINLKVIEGRAKAKTEILEYLLDFTKTDAVIDWDFIDGMYGTDPELNQKLQSKQPKTNKSKGVKK